ALIAIARQHRNQKVVLLLASAVFYMWWNPAFILLILTSATIDYWAADRIDRSESDGRRKFFLTISVVANLGLLAFFKYANFFEHNLLFGFRLLGYRPNWTDFDIVLPVGISFYTFNTISYTVDVYRRRLAPCRSMLDYAVFVTFFPHLVAGPIVRATDFLYQLEAPRRITFDREALFLFLRGLVKKVIVADGVSMFADTIFRAPGDWSSVVIWLAAICFYVQIYCDFSGYTDMAIAVARVVGYKLPQNFDRPYVAASPPEFWRRWHITLSSWLRDYLYIPLGGNRRGRLITFRNLMLTMLIGGLWHGASWNFVLWGALHGLALVVHRGWNRVKGRIGVTPAVETRRWNRIAATVLMQYWILLTWIPFRVSGTHNMVLALRKFMLFDGNFHLAEVGLGALTPFTTLLIVTGFLVIHWWSARFGGLDERLRRASPIAAAAACVVVGAA